MLNASVKGKYAADTSGSAGTVTVNGGDVKIRAAFTEATFADLRFQFMNKVRVLKRELKMTYTHWRRENRVALDGTLVIDPANKFSANYAFDTENCKLKYSYLQGEVLASLNLAEEAKIPKLSAESTWNFDM